MTRHSASRQRCEARVRGLYALLSFLRRVVLLVATARAMLFLSFLTCADPRSLWEAFSRHICRSLRLPMTAPVLAVLGWLFVCLCPLAAPHSVLAATWSPEMQVNVDDTSADWDPVVVADSLGTAWVFWMGVDPGQGDFDIYYSRWTDQGWTLEERAHADNLQKDAWPVACMGRDGIPWVAWDRHRGGTSLDWDVLVSRWSGTHWSEPDTLYPNGGDRTYYDAACTDTGLVWAAVSDFVRRADNTFDADLFFRKCENATWSVMEHIDRPGIDDSYPDIALSPSGVPWVVWGGGTVLCTYRDESGWREPILSHRGSGARMCFSRGGGPWIVFFGDGHLIYSTFWDSEFWRDSGPIPGPYATESEWDYRPVVAGLQDGGPVVVWPRADHENAWRGDVYLSRWAGCWWKPEMLVTESDSEFVAVDEWPEVAVGAGGRTWVVWERYSSPGGGDAEVWARYSDDVTSDQGWVKHFSGHSDGGLVRLEWECEGSIGFNVYRSDAGGCAGAIDGATRDLLTPVPLTGVSGFVDSTAESGRRYRYWLDVVSSRGVCDEVGPVLVKLCEGALRLGVVKVRPNPSGTGFLLGYYGGEKQDVQVEILDVSGRVVRRIGGLEGEGEVLWDGTGADGKEVSPGVYFVRLLLGGRAEGDVEKVLLLR